MLEECHRVLEPGGRIRISTPDLELIIGLNGAEHTEDLRGRYIRWLTDTFLPAGTPYRSAFVINQAFRGWGHRFLYDETVLREALLAAGFQDVIRRSFGESDDPLLRGIDSHGASEDDRLLVAYESLVLEARRP
jgi:predicted SAM-dependent methyltransferase